MGIERLMRKRDRCNNERKKLQADFASPIPNEEQRADQRYNCGQKDSKLGKVVKSSRCATSN